MIMGSQVVRWQKQVLAGVTLAAVPREADCRAGEGKSSGNIQRRTEMEHKVIWCSMKSTTL